uniref:At1g61320/AtMIF1 LRR domain-containing protein n=1 Tax=Oryza glumipatula TaxID=40148 RepID=A0A0E0B4W0_9ORYZ
MGLLALRRLMATQPHRRRRRRSDAQAQARNGVITSMAKRKGTLLQGGDSSSQGGKRLRYSGPDLPEDIWRHIHFLVPLRDAARAACISQAFLRSWRHHPNLILTKKTMGLEHKAYRRVGMARDFTSTVHSILKNHSGIGVKRLKLDIIYDHRNLNICYLNNWLQIAITPGIEEITLLLPSKYTFPCSLLSGGNGRSLQYLKLVSCAFRPTASLGFLSSLTKLHLCEVRIKDDELTCLISNSLALKQLELLNCRQIICLKIPCLLEQLSCLNVSLCENLQMIESKAPNLSTFSYISNLVVELSLKQSSQVKTLDIDCYDESNFLCHVITKFPNIVPNLETLTLHSIDERINTPMVASKFLHLKRLEIYFESLDPDKAFPLEYDYLSLVSILDASPVLDTFILCIQQGEMKHDSVFGDASNLRTMPGHKHESLKDVEIIGFCSATSMVELTCHLLENATSLEYITLDTICDVDDLEDIGRCCATNLRKTGECFPLRREMILEAHRGVMAIERYIRGKVPSKVELTVLELCTWCHDLERLDALDKGKLITFPTS